MAHETTTPTTPTHALTGPTPRGMVALDVEAYVRHGGRFAFTPDGRRDIDGSVVERHPYYAGETTPNVETVVTLVTVTYGAASAYPLTVGTVTVHERCAPGAYGWDAMTTRQARAMAARVARAHGLTLSSDRGTLESSPTEWRATYALTL